VENEDASRWICGCTYGHATNDGGGGCQWLLCHRQREGLDGASGARSKKGEGPDGAGTWRSCRGKGVGSGHDMQAVGLSRGRAAHGGGVWHGRVIATAGGPLRKFNYVKIFQICSNLNQLKTGLLELNFFKIKYGCEGFYVRNNFLYSNFSRFGLDFE
jgi:hypothetical protein